MKIPASCALHPLEKAEGTLRGMKDEAKARRFILCFIGGGNEREREAGTEDTDEGICA